MCAFEGWGALMAFESQGVPMTLYAKWSFPVDRTQFQCSKIENEFDVKNWKQKM